MPALLDKYINENEPWKVTDEKKLQEILNYSVDQISDIGYDLQPFLPQTAKKIINQFSAEKVVSADSLFPRLS